MAPVESAVSAPTPSAPPLAAAASASRGPGLLLPALSLCQRELVRFVRQRHRIIGALGTPIVFWLLLGLGMGHSFKNVGVPGGDDYLKFFFPGTILMILLFTAIFSTISIIEDRREGFLQSVLVAPVSRLSIVLGKILGGAALAFGQGLIFLALAPLIGLQWTAGGFLAACGMMFVVAFALTGLGFCIAWRMSSTQGFHAIMNLFLMPLWFLSGALFPAHNASGPLRAVMLLNPLTYGLDGLREALYLGRSVEPYAAGEIGVAYAATAGFALLLIVIATSLARGRVAADLQ